MLFYFCPCLLSSARTLSGLCFFNDTATTEIYTLSLHHALPIFLQDHIQEIEAFSRKCHDLVVNKLDRKGTRLNSSHDQISYAVFCLKKTLTIKWDKRYVACWVVNCPRSYINI